MCAPGVDQTERNLEEWQFLAPLIEARSCVKQDASQRQYSTDVAHFLNTVSSWDPFGKLALEADADVEDLDAVQAKLTPNKDPSNMSMVESMPSELLVLIFNDVELEAADMVSLGLCSKTLWLQYQDYVQTKTRKAP